MNRKKGAVTFVLCVLPLVPIGASACQGSPANLTESEQIQNADQTSPAQLSVIEFSEEAYPMASPGSYQVGKVQNLQYQDPARNNRDVSVTIWYPTIGDGADSGVAAEALPDLGAAPYPTMLSSTKVAKIFAPLMVSQGFAWISVDYLDSSDTWGKWVIDQPRDLLFALDTFSQNTPEGLEGVLDTDNVGAIGYSFDALNALTLSGARIDPEAYAQNCATAQDLDDPPQQWWIDYCCAPYKNWDEFIEWAGPALTDSEDGLWQPITDDRLKAFMPMAPEGAWLFNQRGLAVVDRPILIIGAQNDTINYYDLEAAYISEYLGAPDKRFITFLDKGHMMIFSADDVSRMKHFIVAFFGYHLQGREDLEYYFSEEFVNGHGELFWGQSPK